MIKEANQNGARLNKACEVLEISVATYRRWSHNLMEDKRKGAVKNVPKKLSKEEEQAIVDICCSKEYIDMNPYAIHASLLDKGIYLASVSTFYRILNDRKLLVHRGKTKSRKKHQAPEAKIATGPNQVWCWDITYIKTDVFCHFYYAYTIIDIFDRSIVKWAIHERESGDLAREMFEEALRDNDYPDVRIHSDNGSPMKATTLLGLFYDLGLSNSYSRPRVSNDNAFIESWFKTLKYGISYPGKFSSLAEARNWFASFVHSYNTAHRHSGLHFLTPFQVRNGEYSETIKKRNYVMLEAREKYPLRWSSHVKQLPEIHSVTLNAAHLLKACNKNKDSRQFA